MYEKEHALLKEVSGFVHTFGGCNDPLIKEIKPIIKPLYEQLTRLLSSGQDANPEAIDKAYRELFAAFEPHKNKKPTSESSGGGECQCHEKPSEAELASKHSFMSHHHGSPHRGAGHSPHSYEHGPTKGPTSPSYTK